MIQKILAALVAPAVEVRDAADRRRARLLASILITLLAFGFASGLLQLALIPGFLLTFAFMLGALAVVGAAYFVSRTSHFRKAAWAACIAPLLACFAIIVSNPKDVVAGPFMLVGVLLAGTFLEVRATIGTAVAALLALAAALSLQGGPIDMQQALPLLLFHAVLSALLVVASIHRDGMERLREAETRQRDAALNEQKQLETLGRLAGGIAHDFNNLLLVVQANAELLERRRDPAISELTADILQAASRGAGLTRQILATARKQHLEPQPVRLNSLLSGVESLLKRLIASHVTVVIEPSTADAMVIADRTQLEQVLLNLALNGRDAMPNGGLLKIQVLQHAPSSAREAQRNEWTCLRLSDTGMGMDPLTQLHIFDPFFTTKGANGHGLGLATVRGIVEQSGGIIEVTSAPDQGSHFDVYLPLADPSARFETMDSEPALVAARAPRQSTILVLDDDEAVLRVVGHMLGALGYLPLLDHSAGEAIDLFERERCRVDLFLCDLLVPAMNGLEVAALLERRRPTLRVLFMSGYADSRIDAVCAMPSMSLIAKPFSSEDLRDRIERNLAAAPAAAGSQAMPN